MEKMILEKDLLSKTNINQHPTWWMKIQWISSLASSKTWWLVRRWDNKIMETNSRILVFLLILCLQTCIKIQISSHHKTNFLCSKIWIHIRHSNNHSCKDSSQIKWWCSRCRAAWDNSILSKMVLLRLFSTAKLTLITTQLNKFLRQLKHLNLMLEKVLNKSSLLKEKINCFTM